MSSIFQGSCVLMELGCGCGNQTGFDVAIERIAHKVELSLFTNHILFTFDLQYAQLFYTST
jgi:hypothetical protein